VKFLWCCAVQVRLELSYRGALRLPVTLEVHAINDATHSKVASWLPDSEKMHAELEGNCMSRTLNVSPLSPCDTHHSTKAVVQNNIYQNYQKAGPRLPEQGPSRVPQQVQRCQHSVFLLV